MLISYSPLVSDMESESILIVPAEPLEFVDAKIPAPSARFRIGVFMIISPPGFSPKT